MKLYALLLTGLVFFSTAALAVDEPSPEKINEVHQREKLAEPFDVDQVIEMFTKTVHHFLPIKRLIKSNTAERIRYTAKARTARYII